MKHKKIFLLICLVICVFSMASVCASEANDTAMASEDIDQINDVISVEEDTKLASFEENEILSAGDQSFAQLNATINGNTDNDIYLNSNYKYSDGDDSFKGGIVIDRDVTIYGNGHTIDGNKEARIFQVNGGNVVFYNITFINGKVADGNGGAINGECKAINCTFKNNQAESTIGGVSGGAMYYGSAVNCTFTENSAYIGGAMFYGSAVNCTFTENGAGYGGAMDTCSAVNCTFTGNTAESGGAMYECSAVNCTFTGNTAVYGGAMCGGYRWNCIGQNHVDYFSTQALNIHWDANDFTTIYGSGETLPIKLMNQNNNLISFINYDVVIYNKTGVVKTYHCLSNDDLSLDLLPGIYTVELTVTYPGLDKPEPKNITLTLTDGTTFSDLKKTINDNANATINLDKNYTFNPAFDSAFTNGIEITRPVTINGNGAVIDAKGNAKIFKVQSENVTFKNITFKNGKPSSNFGGAIYFQNGGSLFDCIFMNNIAKIGGAVYFYSGNSTVHRCTFINNTAVDSYSAIQLSFGNGSVIGCIFMNNTAGNGVVGTDSESHGQIEISNNIFLNNTVIMDVINFACNEKLTTDYNWFGNVAGDYGNGVPSQTSNVWLFLNATVDNNRIPISDSSAIVFRLYAYNKTNLSAFDYDNSLLKPVYLEIFAINGTVDREVALLEEKVKFTATGLGIGRVTARLGNVGQSVELEIIRANSTLTIDNNITFDYNGVGSAAISFTNASGVNASVIGQPNAVVNVTGNTITVSGLNPGNYTLSVTTIVDDKHNNVTKTVNITVNKAKTELTADEIVTTYTINKDLIVTLKDAHGIVLTGAVVTVDLNGAKNYTTDKDGQVKISTKGLAANIYKVLITFNGTENYVNSSNTTTVSIYKESSRVDTKPLTTDYNVHKYLVVALKDNEGNPICNADAYIEIHGVTYKCRSDEKGDARLIIRLNPGTYTAKITFDNVNYTGFTQYITVIVKKLTPKLTAKKKTFKKSKKVKKYTVTLKDNNGKAIKKAKVTIKIGKKTYKATTNAKGKAIFKIKKLTKKGKYKATVKYNGNYLYNKVIKKVKITVK